MDIVGVFTIKKNLGLGIRLWCVCNLFNEKKNGLVIVDTAIMPPTILTSKTFMVFIDRFRLVYKLIDALEYARIGAIVLKN